MSDQKKILIAPLDWGIGHAARCIPIIKNKLSEGHEVILASNGRSTALLQSHFPQLKFIEGLPDYAITYSGSTSFMAHLIKQIPHILRTIKREHVWLQSAITKYHIDEVISDNRYGLYNSSIPSSIITHQLFPVGPALFTPVAHRIIKKYLSHFDECLIPDYENESISLSGKLSHGNIPPNVRYIGPLSRFDNPSDSLVLTDNFPHFEFLIILSGPEPQRSIFESLMIRTFEGKNETVCIIGGRPDQEQIIEKNNIRIYPHLRDDLLAKAITQSKNIISRSGYSTLMDLRILNRSALLIPTPGQTEQEYLARRFSNNFGFFAMNQDEVSYSNIISTLSNQH